MYYEVFHAKFSLWWCGKKFGWIDIDELNHIQGKKASDRRRFKTANRALRHILTLPVGSRVVRVSVRKGKRYITGYTKVK